MKNYCPKCGAKITERERRPNGNSRCETGHTFPTSQAVEKRADNHTHVITVDGLMQAMATLDTLYAMTGRDHCIIAIRQCDKAWEIELVPRE